MDTDTCTDISIHVPAYLVENACLRTGLDLADYRELTRRIGALRRDVPPEPDRVGCSDNDIGLKAESGGAVSTCAKAHQYCAHVQFKEVVVRNCPKTCGACG